MKKLLILSAIAIASISYFSCKAPQSFDYRGMQNFKIEKLGFDYSTIYMDLIYFNPNNFGVDLKHVDCDVYVDNRYVGKYLLDTTMHINRKSEFALPSRMNVDMRNLFKNGFQALTHKDVLVTLKGTTKIGKGGIYLNIPVNYEGRHQVDLF